MEITGIILAGGKSQRMGTNKAMLVIDGKRNIERIAQVIGEVTNQIYIAANEQEPYQFLHLPIIADKVSESGPLAGIHSAMLATDSEYYLAVACDLPFLTATAMTYMLEQCQGYDGVVPVISGRKHPLFAIYHRSVLPVIEAQLKEKNLKVMNTLAKLHIRYVDEKEFIALGEDVNRLFLNMNKPEDYEAVIKMED